MLIQAYERRVLTYVPANRARVAGADGQHWAALLPVPLRGAAGRAGRDAEPHGRGPGYHFASLLTLKTQSLTLPFARQAGDYQAPNRTHFTQQATDGTSEIITIGPTLYLKTGGGAWRKAPRPTTARSISPA